MPRSPVPETGPPLHVHAQSAGLGDNEVSRSGNNRGPRDSVCQVTDLVGPSEVPRGVPVTVVGGRGLLVRVIELGSKGS